MYNLTTVLLIISGIKKERHIPPHIGQSDKKSGTIIFLVHKDYLVPPEMIGICIFLSLEEILFISNSKKIGCLPIIFENLMLYLWLVNEYTRVSKAREH